MIATLRECDQVGSGTEGRNDPWTHFPTGRERFEGDAELVLTRTTKTFSLL
jgi:hypothetical protein